MKTTRPATPTAPPRTTPRHEYQRLLAAGVNPRTAEVLACGLAARHERAVTEATRRYAADRARRHHLASNRRLKRCQDCGQVRAVSHMSRHRRTHDQARQAA